MIAWLCFLVGIYIIADGIYLAAKADEEKRFCVLAKYTFAMMSGFYILMMNEDSETNLLYGSTIALFMWPETYYRLIGYVYKKHPSVYFWLLNHINIHYRRKGDLQ